MSSLKKEFMTKLLIFLIYYTTYLTQYTLYTYKIDTTHIRITSSKPFKN